MGKILTLNFISNEDDWGISTSEEVNGITDSGTEIRFYAHDLSDCPEDAILGRDLFTGSDFISALELGMKLAEEGYDEISLNFIKNEDY